ncbi:sensor histidine kinase [Micromonospora echinofusca]|uniref:histidine kinase n=1 Tax=Micromonospora echinofusca TaxID=47858 RepID=A0ABS3VRB9_MICEH|nr:nitrate- and nitrite sensing domain-containing protein [Micromonospora echinofusca]MBO4207026.1 HAMP domain-containing protein [Micromonospora echinofusca]
MLFGRLRITGKLALLILVPLIGVVALTVPIVTNRLDMIRRAHETSDAVNLAGRMGSALQEMQEERILSLGYLFGLVQRPVLAAQSAKTTNALADFGRSSDIPIPAPLAEAAARAEGLHKLRAQVIARTARPDEIIDRFGAVIGPIIEALDLVRHADMATSAGRQVVALDSLFRNDEAISQAACFMLATLGTGVPQFATRAFQALTTAEADLRRVTTYATPEQAELYLKVQKAFNLRVGPEFFVLFFVDPIRAMKMLPLATALPSLSSVVVLGRFVEAKITVDVIAAVAEQRRQAAATAYTVSGLSVLLLAVVTALGVAMTRSVARPLRRLTGTADRIVRAAEEELRRVADDDSYFNEPIRLDPLDIVARDEIGDLARAFDKVQSTAVQLVERQITSRRNVAQMFGHVGRRAQNLVSRQLALIDQLERDETDTDRLRELYRLDHMSSRLRRNASSLVVLSGADGSDEHILPLPLVDVVRLALAEIEDYTRVNVDVPADITVAPAVVGDLTLLFAELMENATVFSPPHRDVAVTAVLGNYGVQLGIVDHGLGLSDERLAEENARIHRRERLDLVPTEVLGLFVVGRLARRHGIAVTLDHTPGGGLTATVELSAEHLTATPPEALIASGTLTGWAAPAPLVTAGPGSRATAVPQWSGTAPVQVPHPHPMAPVEPPAAPLTGPFDHNLLERAGRMLATAGPWNGFAAPGQHPAQVVTVPAQPAYSLASITRPVPAPSGPPESRGGLTRRVPGATLVDALPPVTPRQDRSAPRLDPDEARNLMEQFESGVALALSEGPPR